MPEDLKDERADIIPDIVVLGVFIDAMVLSVQNFHGRKIRHGLAMSVSMHGPMSQHMCQLRIE